jgi:hypothetical protein
LENLSLPELEQALQVVAHEQRIPHPLQHLTPVDWQHVSLLLDHLMLQRQQSPLH